MSVTAPRDSPMDAEDAQRPVADLGLDAWALCAEFTERILSEARLAAAGGGAILPDPDIDWERMWRAGDGAPSDEEAIGRIVQAAAAAARTIALHGREPASPPVSAVGQAVVEPQPEPRQTGRPVALVEPDPGLTEPPADGDAPQVVVEPMESVPSVVAPLAVLEAPPGPEPTAGPESTGAPGPLATVEPVTTLVVAQPAQPESLVEPVRAPEEMTTDAVAPVVPGAALPAPALIPLVEPVDLQIVHPIAGEADGLAAAAPRSTRTHAGWATFFTWIRNLGIIILLFVVWQLWGTGIAQHQAQSQLKSQFDAEIRMHHPPKATGAGPALIPAAVRVPTPANGTVVAELQIPSIGVDQYVVSGTDAAQLSQGPGHYVGTAVPGQAGNVAIAGHRTTNGAPFNRLGQLVKGDRIILTTTSGEHLTYRVSGTPVAVSPSDVSVLNYFGDNRITLTTCTPEFSAAQRLIAVGLLQAGAPPKVPASHLTYHVENPATASWDWSLLPAVGIEICLLVLLGLSYKRFDGWFGRHGKWFILVPVWAAGLYLLFTSLTSFLPSTY